MRVVLVEDHRMFRELFHKACSLELGLKVVGEAGTGQRAMQVIESTLPDLVILDLHLPNHDGFEVAEFTRARWPSIQILMISSHCDDYTLFQVEQSGSQGFLEKNTQSIRSLKQAVEALRRGETYFSRIFLEAKRARANDPENFTKILSERELDVLALIGESMTDEEIALRLEVSPSTAQTHRSKIMRKLGLANSTKLALFAIKHGISRTSSLRNGKPVLP